MTVFPFDRDEETSMDSQDKKERAGLSETEVEARRTFLKRAGKATATAPAVALLLAASTKAASAQSLLLRAGGEGVRFRPHLR